MANLDINSLEYRESLLGPAAREALGLRSMEQVTVLQGWRRGGAETYIADFTYTDSCVTRRLIAKACIKFSPAAVMQEWVERRRVLMSNCVLMPELVAVDGGTLVEEYIDFDFKDAFHNAEPERKIVLREKYLEAYKLVAGAGFLITSFSDLRSHGSDAVVVDVGEDLGAPMSIGQCNLSVMDDAKAHLARTLGAS